MQHNIAIYLRISFDKSGLGIGVNRQRVDCNMIASTHYPDHARTEYIDNDESAYSTRARRPAYQQLMADVESGLVHAIVAWDQDRLLRQPRQLEELIDLCVPLGIPVRTARGDLDLASHDGQLYARISAAVAKKSSDDTSRRVKRAAKDRAEAGQFHGGRYLPYGLQRAEGKLIHDPAAVQVVRGIATRVLAGDTLTAILRDVKLHHPGAPRSREGLHRNVLHAVTATL